MTILPSSQAVRVEKHERVAQIIIDWPPVNVLSHPVRLGLVDALKASIEDATVDAIVISGAGRTFVAGGDIMDFGRPIRSPDVNDILDLIESSHKPVIAALHGTVLGGGLELAMACHWRIAATGTKLGFPEVGLGLIPGAGGTIRLPHLVGVKEALTMIGTGAPIDAGKALEIGLIGQVADDVLEAALTAARGEIATTVTSSRIAQPRDQPARAALLEAARADLRSRFPWSEARQRAVDSVDYSLAHPYSDALANERRLFEECVAGPEAKALIHMFFAERKVTSVPGLRADAPVRAVRTAAVIGSGTMGRGIAIVLAKAGLDVALIDMNDAAIGRAIDALDDYFAREVARGRSSEEAARKMRGAIAPGTDIEAAASCDLVIEAVFEERAVKRDLFAKLDAIAKPGAILATNTSSLDVLDLANATSRPADIIGLHFFSPAQVMPLLEIVRTTATSDDVLKTAVSLSGKVRKTGVVVGNCFGFVANRMIFAYQRQSEFLVEEGATPARVDSVLKRFGMPMGPFEMFDMAGLDVGWRIRKDREALRPKDKRYSILNDLVCEAGWYGQKTGRGWHAYAPGHRAPQANSELRPLIEKARSASCVTVREVDDAEILDRCILALVNEAAFILDEGYAARASDIDVIYVAGFGFPRYRGGPMFYADQLGLNRVLSRIRSFESQDPDWWKPSPLLVRLAESGRRFADFDKERG